MGARAHSHTDTHTATLRRGDCRPRGSGACALLGEGQCVGLGAAGGQGRREGSLASGPTGAAARLLLSEHCRVL